MEPTIIGSLSSFRYLTCALLVIFTLHSNNDVFRPNYNGLRVFVRGFTTSLFFAIGKITEIVRV